MDMNKYERLKTWAQEADEQRRSGMNQVDWCRIHGVNIHTFKYRLRVLKKEADQLLHISSECSNIQFAEIPMPTLSGEQQRSHSAPDVAVTIIMDQMRIQIGNHAAPELVGSILKAVCHAQ